jgi:hypothetical protein
MSLPSGNNFEPITNGELVKTPSFTAVTTHQMVCLYLVTNSVYALPEVTHLEK